MAQYQGPSSYRMASEEMRGFCRSVELAAKALLLEHGVTGAELEDEVRALPGAALQKALKRAMKVSSTRAVQPDYLVAIAAMWVWLLACKRCGYKISEYYPALPIDIPGTDMYDSSVLPSPEHEARIKKENERKSRKEVAKQIKAEETDQAAGRSVQLPPSLFFVRRGSAMRGDSCGQGAPAGSGTPAPVPNPQIEARRDGEPSTFRSDDDDRITLVTAYFFKVENPATEFMHELWHRYDFEALYPTSDGYTCTGRPFEVKLHRDKAITFFGPRFCDRERILRIIRRFAGVEVYAHWQGDFVHIGLTTDKGKYWTNMDDSVSVIMFLHVVMRAFNTLAGWAAGITNGESQTRYAIYMNDLCYAELKNLGVPVGGPKCVIFRHQGKSEEVASADDDELEGEDKADGPVGEARAPEKIEKSKGAETRKGKEKSDPKKGLGKGSSLSAADVAMDAELERCKKAMQSILKEKSGTVRLEKATVWLLKNTPKMKHLDMADVVACLSQWWRDNLGLGHNQLEMGQADEFERLTMGFISRRATDEGLANPDDKTNRSEEPMLGASKEEDAQVMDPHTGILADGDLCDTDPLESGDELW